MQVLLKANEPFKGSGENKSTEWAVMVSQGDITLLQKIAQPKVQSQLVWSSAGSAWGERRGAEDPILCRETGPLFRGKQGFLSPPRPGRKVRAPNANCSGNSTIFVANDGSALSATKPVASNYIVNIKCLSLETQVCKHLFVDFGNDLKPFVAEQRPKSALLCNLFCTLKTRVQ